MHANESNDKKQPAKRSAFTIMNNVRDYCEQSDAKKILLFTLATYCDGKGICYPRNRTLVQATRKSDRTIRRMLRQLEADGEFNRQIARVIPSARSALQQAGKRVGFPFKSAC